MNQDSEFDQLLFFFERHRDIELEDGYVLAGILIVDLPTPDHMTAEALAKSRKMTSEIIMHLSRMAADGHMPDDAQIFGWKDGKDRPDETTDDDELLHTWAHNKLCPGPTKTGYCMLRGVRCARQRIENHQRSRLNGAADETTLVRRMQRLARTAKGRAVSKT